MSSRDTASSEITPSVLLRAYACGIFPMSESVDDPTIFWVEPENRGIIPLDGFRVASRLREQSDRTASVSRSIRRLNRQSQAAPPQPGRDDTRINGRIRDLYTSLHEIGHCHSVEVWRGGDLIGGL